MDLTMLDKFGSEKEYKNGDKTQAPISASADLDPGKETPDYEKSKAWKGSCNQSREEKKACEKTKKVERKDLRRLNATIMKEK